MKDEVRVGSSVLGLANTVVVDGERGLSLGKTGTVIDLADTGLVLALAEGETSGGGVGDDVTTDGLLGVRHKHRSSIDLGHHLVGDHDSHSKLVGQTLQFPEEAAKMHLAISEFTTTTVVRSVQGGGTIDDDEGVVLLTHHGRGSDEELGLVVSVVGTGDSDVVEDVLTIKTKPLGDGHETFGTERSLSVDVEGTSISTTLIEGELGTDTELVAELGLSCSELTKDLSDGAGLDSSLEEIVEFCAACGEMDDLEALLVPLGGGREAHGDELRSGREELVGLGLCDSLDGAQGLSGGESNGLYCVEASLRKLLDV